MEKIADIADRYRQPRKRINQFYELCKFYSDTWNLNTEAKKVTPQRFMRDCKKNRRAYELAQIDYLEVSTMDDYKHKFKEPKAKIVLLFGRLKARKVELDAQH